VTNWFVNNHLRYEKRNDTECCVIGGGPDVGFVLEFDAGNDHNHDASNHGHGPATSRVALDDNNDARGRLLIARAGRGYVCRRHGPVAVCAIQKAALDSTGHKSARRTDSSYREPVARVVTRLEFLSGRFCALGFLFLRLTHYGRDRLKLFAIAEIH
jgi:hypothetical protein